VVPIRGPFKMLEVLPRHFYMGVPQGLQPGMHTAHATEIEIDQSEFSTRDKLVFLRHKERVPRERGCRPFSRASCLYSFTSNVTPVILARFTFIYMNAGKQVLISKQF